jgi:cytochrome P450
MQMSSSERFFGWFARTYISAFNNHGACRPERWEAIPEAVKAIPGVFGNLLTFINGAHACIGYRFAVTE